MKFSLGPLHYNFTRIPKSNNPSLRAWSAADENIIHYVDSLHPVSNKIGIWHDRFGFLTCFLASYRPMVITYLSSQELSITKNIADNFISHTPDYFHPIGTINETVDLALVNVPKSMDLFLLYLFQIHASLSENGKVVCGFMTKHFTPKMLELCSLFFSITEQSKAHKKARLLFLSKKKETVEINFKHTISFKGKDFKQYLGVFSAKHIDYASQFFIEHLELHKSEKEILDFGSGNGILAYFAVVNKADARLHLVDDSILAIESSKLNISIKNVHFHYAHSLQGFQSECLDIVISNPPFHFEHEQDISIPLTIFTQIKRVLKTKGRFILVANRHLNYQTHLQKFFTDVSVTNKSDRFEIIECIK